MVADRQDDPDTAEAAQSPRLVLSAPNALIGNRVRAHLAAMGVQAEESDLGLCIACPAVRWQTLLESLAVDLSATERRDTRVAVICPEDGRAAVSRSIFRSHSLEEMLCGLQHDWLQQIIDRDRIIMHLQPILQFPPGRLHGYECLMRGVDQHGAIVPPLTMFQGARQLGRLNELDGKCLLAALRAAAKLRASELTIFINVSPGVIEHPTRQLPQMMKQMDDCGLRPQQIALELVETEQVADQPGLKSALRCYRKAGFKVALDDVGAGYSSLLALSRLRPDYIKLDGELVRHAASSALEAKLVADLAETARQHHILTIAEGIETPAQFRLALDCGIRLTQGFFHARPSADALSQAETYRLTDRASVAAGATANAPCSRDI